jgi:hypothetical protein
MMVNHPRRSKKALTVAPALPVHDHEADYASLLEAVRQSFAVATLTNRHLFMTDAEGLNDLYLDSLPAERQIHDCHACRRFINSYGGIVAIDEAGQTSPIFWSARLPEFYGATFDALAARVKRARVVSPFLAKESVWGIPKTGTWVHIAVTVPAALTYRERALTAGQAMAAAKENFRTVSTALAEFKPEMLDEALRILQADALARSEKFIGPVKWLRDLHGRPKGKLGENMLWRAIAMAPEGYCHPKASVIGPLLADIVAGLPFEEIKAKFDAMLHPLRYQRPQAAPSAGNIAAAEALVAKLGIAPSLARRFAKLEDCETLWRPSPVKPVAQGAGVFGHLKAKSSPAVEPVELPTATMTWEKFARTVLPGAEQMEMLAPSHGNYIAMTAAANPDAPPILIWDREERRNSVAWYVYHGGSSASQWGVSGGCWVKVNGVVPSPPLWGDQPKAYLSNGLVIVLDGAVDTRTGQGNALFPETLRDDLHGARATIEAYSKSAEMLGREDASACGYHLGKGAINCTLRALVAGHWSNYRIDRWD